MSGVALAAAGAGFAAIILVSVPRSRFGRRVGESTGRLGAGQGSGGLHGMGSEDADRGPIHRLRLPLALLAAAGAQVFVGGVAGVAAAVLVAAVVWRVLGAVEPVAVRERREQLQRELPVAVDLLGACVRAGAAMETALLSVGQALPGPLEQEFARVRHRLALGSDPIGVWGELRQHPSLAPLGRAMVRAHESGAPVVEAVAALAEELRDRAHFEVEARAKSVDVKSAGPLGLCLLPAFVLIGIVPVIAGLLSSSALLR